MREFFPVAKRLSIILSVTGVLCGIGLWFVTRDASKSLLVAVAIPLGAVLAVLAVYLPWFLAVAIHEFGHVAAGALVKFRFYEIYVLGLSWKRSGQGFKWELSQDKERWGRVTMAPPDDRALISRFRLFILGGPIASILAGGLLFGAGWLSDSKWYFLLQAAGLLCQMALYPFGTKTAPSDATQLYESFVKQDVMYQRCLMTALWMPIRFGGKVGEMSPHIIEAAIARVGSSLEDAAILLVAYLHSMLVGDFGKALERAKASQALAAQQPDGLALKASTAYEAAFASAFVDADVESAKRYFALNDWIPGSLLADR